MIGHLQRLLKDPDLAASVSWNARQKAESLDWNRIEKQWLELLHKTP